MHQQEFRNVICGGCGHVPSIEALQSAVESAWQAGFDRRGAEQLGRCVLGTRKWVGTTEAAALLRSFGIRARIVDFTGQQVLHASPLRHLLSFSDGRLSPDAVLVVVSMQIPPAPPWRPPSPPAPSGPKVWRLLLPADCRVLAMLNLATGVDASKDPKHLHPSLARAKTG